MKKKRVRGKSKRTTWIALFIIVIAIILISSVIYSSRLPPSPKKAASEYFSFSDAGALARSSAGGSNSTILITYIGFGMTPIGGDAHHVVLFFPGGVDPQDYYYDRIPNGTSVFVEVSFQNYISSAKQADGYPIKFKIHSDETDEKEEYVTLVIPESDIVIQ